MLTGLALLEPPPQEQAPGAPKGARFGGLTFLHRFGSSLNMHFHYHFVVVFREPTTGTEFHAASRLTAAHWLELGRRSYRSAWSRES